MNRTLIWLFCLLLVNPGQSRGQSGNPMQIQFVTLGNCAICKQRIELKLSHTPGVITADWDYSNDVMTVGYDEEITDAYQIMLAIADTGHDTEWYPAPDSMYALLIGSCCEYERTIDYTNVQIGYLSLMGLWVWPLGTHEMTPPWMISLFPSVGPGIVTLDFGERLPDQEPVFNLYSMNGRIVYRQKLSLQSRTILDLRPFAAGQYIAIVTHQNEMLLRSKLIIHP